MAVTPQSDKGWIQEALPELVLSHHPTVSDSRHRTWFNGNFGHWQSFQRSVREAVDALNLGEKLLAVKASDPQSYLNFATNEQLLCGDELSVSGRFSQNALHPVIAVARANRVGIRFGDFKTSPESEKATALSATASIPDYAGVEEFMHQDSGHQQRKVSYGLRIVGEAKTPWMHNLAGYVADFTVNKRGGNNPLRRTLGE